MKNSIDYLLELEERALDLKDFDYDDVSIDEWIKDQLMKSAIIDYLSVEDAYQCEEENAHNVAAVLYEMFE